MSEVNNTEFSLKREVLEWIENMVWALVAVVLIFTFVIRTSTVSGESMLPTLQDGDRLLISNLGYTPKQGDIIVFAPDNRSDPPLVKRVIATELQTVDIDFAEGIVYVDGVPLDEPYVNELTFETGNVEFPALVPYNSVFVMGDNRNHSRDSRFSSVGMVDNRTILGKVLVRFFPFDAAGKVQ